MKRKAISIMVFSGIVFILLIIFCIAAEEYGKKMNISCEEAFFGEKLSELQIECTAEDRFAVQPVLDLADEAFSYLGDGDSRELFGKLGWYSYNNYSGVVSEKHIIDFLTAKLDGDSGYLWIKYFQTGYDETGESITGAWGVKVRLSLEKTDGKWVVSDILEPA